MGVILSDKIMHAARRRIESGVSASVLWRLTSLPLCYATSHNTFTVCKVEHFLRIRIRRHFAIIPDCKVAGLESMIK